MNIPESFAAAVEVAAEIVADGAVIGVLPDVEAARSALAGSTDPAATAELGKMVSLAAEYLLNVDDPDDDALSQALEGFEDPVIGPGEAAVCWSFYLSTRSA